MRSFTPRVMLWLAVGLACVVAPIIRFAEHDLSTGFLVSLSIAAMLVLGVWDQDEHITTWGIVAVASCLEVAIQVGSFVLELLVLMLGGFLITLIGRQIRRALDRAERAQGSRTATR
jgi:hypothetical protein